MGKIVAIGGGELRNLETLPIDRYIVSLCKKEQPKALFIPTASHEPSSYIELFHKVYGELGCITDTLYLINDDLLDEEIKYQILSSDIIYVGGGETSFMLDFWKKKHVDTYLKEAYQNDVILSGLSAGSICWFEKGHSDSNIIRDNTCKEYIMIDGLGFIKGIHCPHFNDEERTNDFRKKMINQNEIGIALDEQCALVIINDEYKIIKSTENANAYRFYNKNGELIQKKLKTDDFKPLSTLYEY